jgi:hypothetical protein
MNNNSPNHKKSHLEYSPSNEKKSFRKKIVD